MTCFIPVSYRGRKYPEPIICEVKEISGHFDKSSIPNATRYSLHTEYSFTKRKFNTPLINKHPALMSSYKGVPRLWYDREWAKEFAEFIYDLTEGCPQPEIIEIHPPFKDYCPDFDTFFDHYLVFEKSIRKHFSNTIITMENRAGAQYPVPFLMSSIDDIVKCCQMIEKKKLQLHIAIDYTQLFTSEGYNFSNIPIKEFIEKHEHLEKYKQHISSVHLWGKKQNKKGTWVSHSAGLREMLSEDDLYKFMSMISNFYNDGLSRYFVPEINTSKKYIEELTLLCQGAGITFSNNSIQA